MPLRNRHLPLSLVMFTIELSIRDSDHVVCGLNLLATTGHCPLWIWINEVGMASVHECLLSFNVKKKLCLCKIKRKKKPTHHRWFECPKRHKNQSAEK